jgi:hypothetical protein
LRVAAVLPSGGNGTSGVDGEGEEDEEGQQHAQTTAIIS